MVSGAGVKKLISVIIVTYNNLALLRDCLKSLRKQTFDNLEIKVIFNATPKESIGVIKDDLLGVHCIINESNLLFCRAHNQGISCSKGEFVLCLNDDVVLESNFIEELCKVMSLDEKIGMVSGKILRNNKVTIDSTGLFLGRSRKPVERGYNQQDNGQYNEAGYIFGVSGAAAFYRREMLEEIKNENGYFDERYEIFYEDLDLAWRSKKRGWRAYYNPRALAYHVRGASTKTALPKQKFLRRYNFAYLSDELKVKLIRNRYLAMAKNESIAGFICNLPFILAYELRLYLYILLFCPSLICKFLKQKSVKITAGIE